MCRALGTVYAVGIAHFLLSALGTIGLSIAVSVSVPSSPLPPLPPLMSAVGCWATPSELPMASVRLATQDWTSAAMGTQHMHSTKITITSISTVLLPLVQVATYVCASSTPATVSMHSC